MAHIQQLSFIKTIAQHLTSDYSDVKILEIGSYDVNGSVRKYFLDSNYLGTDLIEGPSVDLVADGHLLTIKIIHMKLQFLVNVLNTIHIGLRLL